MVWWDRNPPKGLCKADTEGGSIGGEAAGRAKRGLKFWWAGKLIFWEGGGINFEFWWGVLIVRIGRYIWVTKQPQCPSGVQRLSISTTSARSARVWWDGWDGRWTKVSFKIQTLWAFRTCIYILVYKIKIVTNILMGLKIWYQVGGWGIQFSKLLYVRKFSNSWFRKLTDISCKSSLRIGNVYRTFNL